MHHRHHPVFTQIYPKPGMFPMLFLEILRLTGSPPITHFNALQLSYLHIWRAFCGRFSLQRHHWLTVAARPLSRSRYKVHNGSREQTFSADTCHVLLFFIPRCHRVFPQLWRQRIKYLKKTTFCCPTFRHLIHLPALFIATNRCLNNATNLKFHLGAILASMSPCFVHSCHYAMNVSLVEADMWKNHALSILEN